ncbi:MAG: class I SAM-dependent methyltransferase [Bacteroidales bacterium]
MKEQFPNFNLNDPGVVSALDELPLWSAPFGIELLDRIHFRKNCRLLDIGSGTGFPLLEVAERMGEGSMAYGIDPWREAVDRINHKVSIYGIRKVEVIQGMAENMPFQDNTFDLVLSNNGLNNVEDIEKVLSECYRVTKPGAQLLFTANLPGTMIEFYRALHEAVRGVCHQPEVWRGEKVTEQINRQIEEHIHQKRKPLEETVETVERHGFDLQNIWENKFQYRFIDGTAFLNYHFIRLAFLPAWKEVIPEVIREKVFEVTEQLLNEIASERGELSISIPYACYDFRRRQ